MKKLLFFAGLAVLSFSCEKKWECCVKTTTEGHEAPNEHLNSTMEHCIDFKGTTKDKKEFEEQGTSVKEFSKIGGGTLTITQETNCKI